MPGVNFDRAAEYYDETRGLPEGVAERIRDAIIAFTKTDKASKFLEMGIGTGRIALPFIRGGYDYTGVDISLEMMAKLEQKLAGEDTSAYNFRLQTADITHLPFADNIYDVALMVHVLHLVPNWQAAVEEARRVLQPGGWLVVGNELAAKPKSEVTSYSRSANDQWYTVLRELGVNMEKQQVGVNWRDPQPLLDYLAEIGANAQLVDLLTYEFAGITPRAMLARHRDRLYSSDWTLPEDIHAEAVRRVQNWLDHECPSPDQLEANPASFRAIVATWPD